MTELERLKAACVAAYAAKFAAYRAPWAPASTWRLDKNIDTTYRAYRAELNRTKEPNI